MIKKFNEKTNLRAIKYCAGVLAFTKIHKTEFSPIVVQHPFTSSGIVNIIIENGEPKLIDITTDIINLYQWQRTIHKKIKSSRNVFEIYMMINKPYAMTFLDIITRHLSQKDFSKILADAWISSENPNSDTNISKSELLSMFRSAEPKWLMSKQELNTLNNLDDTITIYRGVTSYNAKNIKALSWTLDKDIAKWFATRFNENGKTYQAQIKKKYIYAYFDRRNESEIIVNPRYLTNITEIELQDNSFFIVLKQ